MWSDTNHVAAFHRLVNSTLNEYPAGDVLFWNSVYSRVRQVIKIVLVCNGLPSQPTEFSEMAVDQILALLLDSRRWWYPESLIRRPGYDGLRLRLLTSIVDEVLVTTP